jgi:cellobiose-specific phosphotransferase system component IIA
MSFTGIFGKKHEEERLEANMLDSFTSDLESDTDRVRRKLVKRAEAKPQETVVLLLRNLENENGRVRNTVLSILTQLAGDRPILTAIMGEMVHPSRGVRKAVQTFLGEYVGPHAIIYASLYEQTMLMVAMSKRKDVPVEDIVSLAELSKETFMDGEVMEAIRDIGFCLDQAKHRYRSSEQLKDYLSDFLKMAPDLSRMGVYSGSIEEPLRKAMKAARNRSFDETKEMIEERSREAELRHDLQAIVQVVGESITVRPKLDIDLVSAEGREDLSTLRGVNESVETLLIGGRRIEAIVLLHGYIDGFLRGYETMLRPKVRAGDQGAVAIMYTVSLSCVKMASRLLPVTAEGAYLKGFRSIELAASIHVVSLPDDVAH